MDRQTCMRLLTRCTLMAAALTTVWFVGAQGARVTSAAPRARNDVTVVRILGPSHPPGLDPYIVTIHAGDSVTFENDATPEAAHSVIAEDGTFASPSLQPGEQWTTTFGKQGSYIYHDPNAYTEVVGLIIVVPLSTELQPTAPPGAVATIVARAKGSRDASQSQSASSSPSSPLLWLLLPVAAGAGGLAYILYRRRRRMTAM